MCIVPMNTRTYLAATRKQIEEAMRWNNIVRNLARLNAKWLMLMDLEFELRSMDYFRLTLVGILFDAIEGQV